MAQRLRARVCPCRGPQSTVPFPAPRLRGSQLPVNSRPRGSHTSGPHKHLHSQVNKHSHIHLIKNNKKKFVRKKNKKPGSHSSTCKCLQGLPGAQGTAEFPIRQQPSPRCAQLCGLPSLPKSWGAVPSCSSLSPHAARVTHHLFPCIM